MAILQKAIEMRGMSRNDIVNYFISINGKSIGSVKFFGENWEVDVGQETLVTIGSFNITSTTVIFRCEEELLEPMISAFRLKFLSAGG